jgi:surface antigen
MLRRIARLPKVMALLATFPAVVAAAGWGAVLHDSPLEDFSDVELRMYLDTIKSALDAAGPPRPHEWKDEHTGAGATVLVVGDAKVAGFKECRRFKTQVYSKRHQGTASVFTACRSPEGRWSLVAAH